jgi:hypothetical protein
LAQSDFLPDEGHQGKIFQWQITELGLFKSHGPLRSNTYPNKYHYHHS